MMRDYGDGEALERERCSKGKLLRIPERSRMAFLGYLPYLKTYSEEFLPGVYPCYYLNPFFLVLLVSGLLDKYFTIL